jgi:hypothetical protein
MVLLLLCPLGMLAGLALLIAKLVGRLRGGGASGVRTHIGDDGFWIYSPDTTRGRPISYRTTVGGADQEGTIASPGSQGEYVYTGGRPTAVKVLGMAAAAAAAGALGQRLTSRDDDWQRQRDEEERRRRDSSSSFIGYPSAY